MTVAWWPLLPVASSFDPDPAHAPTYGWPVAAVFGLVVVVLLAWTVHLHRGGWGRTRGESEDAPSGLPGLGRDDGPTPDPGWQAPEPVVPGRRGGLFRTYRPAEPPAQIGPFGSRTEAESHKRQLDEHFSDYLNSYEGYFEVQQDAGRFIIVRTLGRDRPRPVPGARTAGLGP